MYQTGEQNFVPDLIRESAEVMVIGQNPGEVEEQQGAPFVGQTGKVMSKDFLPIAGLTRDSVSIGNALRCRWNNSNFLPTIESVLARDAVQHCTKAHLVIPAATKLIVATGGYAALACSGLGHQKNNKVTHLRGWLLPLSSAMGGNQTSYETEIYTPHCGVGLPPVLATVHVAALNYDPKLRLPAKMDWAKVRRFLKGTWPLPPPEIHREIDEYMFDYEAAWDTEYVPEIRRLLRFSVATASGRVYVIENSKDVVASLGRVAAPLKSLPQSLRAGLLLTVHNGVWSPARPNVLPVLRCFFQNAGADLDYMGKILPRGTTIALEDEMLAHSVLHGGFPHSLDYQASLHASINRHKHLQYTNEVLYSGMDALTQLQVWRATERELRDDPQSEQVYRSRVLPLIPIILEAEKHGVLIDQAEVQRGLGYLDYEITGSALTAQAAVGYNLNLGSSQQLGRQLYGVEALKPPRGKR